MVLDPINKTKRLTIGEALQNVCGTLKEGDVASRTRVVEERQRSVGGRRSRST